MCEKIPARACNLSNGYETQAREISRIPVAERESVLIFLPAEWCNVVWKSNDAGTHPTFGRVVVTGQKN